MRVSIGILAWNEAQTISKTIESLFAQTLFSKNCLHIESLELVCVPNGCTDRTSEVAQETMNKLMTLSFRPNVVCRVCEVTDAGKGNAWNEFVHRISDQGAHYLILMDADVQLIIPETLENMIHALEQNNHASVSTPQRVKHVAIKARKTVCDLISLGVSEIGQSRPAMLAGCLYCARGHLLRRIWLPAGLVGEDAFVCAMLVTSLFTRPTDNTRVIRAPNAAVMFESYTRVRDVYYNLRRRAITRGINAMMYTYLWANVGKIAPDAGMLIKKRNDQDSDWFCKLVRENVSRGSWWIMPRGAIRVRLTAIANLPYNRRVLLLPAACIALVVDALVHISANRVIRRGEIKGIWRPKNAS
jgi:glycosyltransferase involved in cell wall biosynthesis